MTKLAAASSDDLRVKKEIGQSFVDAEAVVLWIAVGLALASAMSAAVLIDAAPRPKKSSAG